MNTNGSNYEYQRSFSKAIEMQHKIIILLFFFLVDCHCYIYEVSEHALKKKSLDIQYRQCDITQLQNLFEFDLFFQPKQISLKYDK